MATKKFLHLGLNAQQMKTLDRLALKLGLDKSNTIRYCIARIAEQEGLVRDRSESGAR